MVMGKGLSPGLSLAQFSQAEDAWAAKTIHRGKRSSTWVARSRRITRPRANTAWYSQFADHPGIDQDYPAAIQAAVMPQDRRTAFQTTQHTAQAPIVQPQPQPQRRIRPRPRTSCARAAVQPSGAPEATRTQRVDHPPHPPAIGDPHRGELVPWIRVPY